jgi:cell division protein FtsI/penicillin-binding protein 2
MPSDPWRGGMYRRRNQAAALGLAATVIAAAAVIVLVSRSGKQSSNPAVALNTFARAWSDGHPEAGPLLSTAGVAASYRAVTVGLHSSAPTVTTSGPVPAGGGAREITGRLHIHWTLAGKTAFDYDTNVSLTRAAATKVWKIRWTPASVHPGLQAGDTLLAQSVPAARAAILGAGDRPLVTEQPVVHVGVEPSRVTDLPALTSRLAALLNIDAQNLATRVRSSSPQAFVDVITLRRDAYNALAPQLQPLPGTVFAADQQMLAPTRSFARALLGTVGPVTADILKANPGRFQIGQVVGLSGLQRQYEQQLAGTPGVRVVIHHAAAAPGGVVAPDVQLLKSSAIAGTPLRTTIDPTMQQAADDALSGETKPSALVAVQVSSGRLLAVANGPDGGSYDLGLTAQVPPGSTFKVVSTLALLEGGLDPQSPVPCTPLASVGGRTFHNAEREAFGTVPFQTDFAKSCNTAFVSLAPRLAPDSLRVAAQSLGIGSSLPLGVPAFAGSVPVSTDAVDKAASIFGQGRILLSPADVALSTATVARGTRVSPQLVLGTAPALAVQAGVALPSAALTTLRGLMRDVVTSGTGTALAGVPGGPVYGKTGTAEHGSGANPPSHAWFTGWQGDVAFCVFVQDGEFGGDTAAPIAAHFLTALGAGK